MRRYAAAALAPVLLVLATVTGCAHTPVAPPAPPAPSRPSASGPATASAPTLSPAAAKSIALLKQRRSILASSPSVTNFAFVPESQVNPPRTIKDAGRDLATVTGATLWIPDSSVVGTPGVVADRSLVKKAGTAKKHGLVAVYPDAELLYSAVLVSENPVSSLVPPTDPAAFSAVPTQYSPKGNGPRWSRVTIRGSRGIAFTRGPASEMSKNMGGTRGPEPSFVQWSESGVRYELMSYDFDPDQLVGIANSMISVKP